MLGLIASVFIILLVEILDTNIKNKEDLIETYKLPVLGEIPNLNLSKESGIYKKIPYISKKKRHLKAKNDYNKNLKFIFSESFKSFRTNLRFILVKEGCKKIIISSPLPSDGKSTQA